MANYFFKPSDISTKICTVNNIAVSGAAFAMCEDGDEVYIPAKLVKLSDLEVCDLVTAYCIDNHRPEYDGENFAVRWCAVRVTVTEKFIPAQVVVQQVASTPTQNPMPVAELAEKARAKLSADRAWSASQLAAAVGVDTGRMSSWLYHEHEIGTIAAIRIYKAGDQERASYSYYAKSAQLLVDLIDEVELSDE